MRVVILGASGFIGSAVLKTLISSGKEVCVLVRSDSKFQHQKFSSLVKTVTYESLLNDQLIIELQAWEPEKMINVSWKGVGSVNRSEAYQFDNIAQNLASVKLAAQIGCSQWIGAGSQAEYGLHNKKINETDLCSPDSAYGKAKLATAIAALGLCESLNIIGTWARIFSVYGPGDHSKTFINYLAETLIKNEQALLTKCEQMWDYLYIDDAGLAMNALIDNNCRGIYNVGSGEATLLRDLVCTLKTLTTSKSDIFFGSKAYALNQIMHLQADINKLTSNTSWTPTTTLQQGLTNTVLSIQQSNNESI